MQLSRKSLPSISNKNIIKPTENLFDLPEKIVQFGTGVLLRGLCDYYVDRANRNGKFNGRIVVVKSTSSGGTDEFRKQDNLYTVCVRGLANGKEVNENIINSAISRVLSAADEWNEILLLAEQPNIRIIISNTTEVGLQLVKESIFLEPPASYPAKLLAFLYQRFRHFGKGEKGKIIVIPTELIPSNGNVLRTIIEELAHHNGLENDFKKYLNSSVSFCNSLVDRIVTKDPGKKMLDEIHQQLGYHDDLLTMCEDYHLWAIEGDEHIKSVLTFTGESSGAFVKPDIELYKSLKLHLLNGTHTLSAPLAFLSGFKTVKQAMMDEKFRNYAERLMMEDISPGIPYHIEETEKKLFGSKVLDRFSNPFLEHQWINITLQHTMKMKMRNLPVLKQYHQRLQTVPERMAVGFAAYILFMKPVKEENGVYYGARDGESYRINDDKAMYFAKIWQDHHDAESVVKEVLSNVDLWNYDLSTFAAFADAVENNLKAMLENGAKAIIN